MSLTRIRSLDDPRVDAYRNLRDADVRGRHGAFIAEGRFVVRSLLTTSPLRARSVLVTPAAFEGLADVLDPPPAGTPVFVADQRLMNEIVGFDLHRGCLAVGERPRAPADPLEPLADARLAVVLEGVNNHDNIGAVFRNALAFGAGGVLLSPGCADPLYRKAIRVSMAAALRVPFAYADRWPAALAALRDAGWTVAALTTDPRAETVRSAAKSLRGSRVALLLGAEGHGLTPPAAAECGRALRIPMAPGVDSLNVAAAAAIALHRLADL